VAVTQALGGASEVASDFKYFANNVTDDAIDLGDLAVARSSA
jgi:hypothetical protein